MPLEADVVPYTEPLVWTPGHIQQFATNLHNAIVTFNNDVARASGQGKVPPQELEAWRAYRDEWAKWYGSTDYGTWLWSSNVSLIEGYANRLNVWADKYKQWTGEKPSGTGTYKVENPLDSPLLWLGIGAIGAAGLYLFLDRRPRT